jgi:hypothetical protein
VQKLLDDLEARGAFSAPARVRFWSRGPADSSHTDIAIVAGPRRLHMGSDGRQPVLATPGYDGEIDRQFCKLWSDLDRALMSLRPDEGQDAGELEFDMDWLP